MINAYPLQWPEGWPRTASYQKEHARFHTRERVGGTSYKMQKDLSIADGLDRVLDELQKLGIKRDDIVISSNLETRLDGLPRSNQGNPSDPGVAVYWQPKKGGVKVLAVDRFYRVADNLAAVAATLGALRSIERWGGGQILDRAFTGFAALPGPDTVRSWREILGVGQSERDPDKVKAAYRLAASRAHPDKGGSDDRMAEVNAAWDRAQQEL